MRLVSLLAALLLGACAATVPEVVTVTPAAPDVPQPAECHRKNPPPVAVPDDFVAMEPRAREIATLRILAAKDQRTARIEGWRSICSAGLKAAPPKRTAPAS